MACFETTHGTNLKKKMRKFSASPSIERMHDSNSSEDCVAFITTDHTKFLLGCKDEKQLMILKSDVEL